MNGNAEPTAYGRIFAPRADWLAKTPAEAVLEPELEIIDTHHHFWETRGGYLLDDLLADTGSGHNVVATVFIECRWRYRREGPEDMRPVGEVEAVAEIAARCEAGGPDTTRAAAGIVGFADLTLGNRVAPVLEAMQVAGGGRLRGIRHAGGWHEDPVIGNSHHGDDPGLYLRQDFRAGLRRLTAMGLSLDGLVYHPQHADLVDLARACPEANIIMNHTGMPLGYGPYAGKRDEVYAQWRRTMSEIARCPNVTMKLGGMMMRLAAYDYNQVPAPPSSEQLAEHWRPYIEPCIELFGAERCTFESNFPVDKMGIGYRALWNAFKRIAAGASPAEKAALFSGTARRVYRLA
ncbi:MAG: amidohydrolase family protein [Alphaproteobacteria bacterium]|nr:amidohydrolase family protein [Alphaproteobacteria bacterium]